MGFLDYVEKKYNDVVDTISETVDSAFDAELDTRQKDILDDYQQEEQRSGSSSSGTNSTWLQMAKDYAPIAGVGIALAALLFRA